MLGPRCGEPRLRLLAHAFELGSQKFAPNTNVPPPAPQSIKSPGDGGLPPYELIAELPPRLNLG